MKFSLCFLVLLICSNVLQAQDQLFKKDNSKIEVKIIEINQNEIKYKLFTYQDGPTIIVSKKDVAMIIYQNGTHEVFNQTESKSPDFVVEKSPSFETVRKQTNIKDSIETAQLLSTKNLIAINLLEPINGCFNINYTCELLNNYVNIYVPVTVGFTTPFLNQSMESSFNPHLYNYYNINNFTFTRKVFETGLGIHFQSSGNKPVTHFVGPYFSFAQYQGTFDKQIYSVDINGNYYYTGTTQNVPFMMNRYYFMLNNGVLFKITKNFNMMMMAAIGHSNNEFTQNDPIKHRETYYSSYAAPRTANTFPINAFKFNFSMGYKF